MISPSALIMVALGWPLALAGSFSTEHLFNSTKPPAFFLAGDSMTAVQSTNGGGYGLGFLSFLKSPAWGIDYGQDGATTVSFVRGGIQGNWTAVMGALESAKQEFEVFVPIMFGANDQKPAANETLLQYQTNLQNLALDVKEAGGNPTDLPSTLLLKILLTPMSRRDFTSQTNLTQNLIDQRTYTIYAARNTSTAYLDFNLASTAYLSAIGNASAQTYDLACTDKTHLNSWGSVVFGRMLADLLLGQVPAVGMNVDFVPPNPSGYFARWFMSNETLSEAIWGGEAIYGGDCSLE